MAKTLYTQQQVAEWAAWRASHPRATHADIARQFGVKLTTVRSQMQRHGFVRGSDYAVDPFGAAAADIRTACSKALANSGSMSQGEYDRLVQLVEAANQAIK